MVQENLKKVLEWRRLPNSSVVLSFVGLFLGLFMYSIKIKAIAIGVLSLAGISLFFVPIRWAILFLCFYLGIEGFGKIITGYNPIIHIGADVLIVILWGRCVFRYLQGELHIPSQFPPLTIFFVIHGAWFLITLFNPYALSLFASLAGAKLYLTIMSGYFFGYYLVKDIKSAQLFMAPWVAVAVIQSIASIYQASVGPTSVLSLGPYYAYVLEKYNGYAFRPLGLTAVPGAPCIFIVIALAFALYFLFFSGSWWISILMTVSLPLYVATLFVCQVRSALLKCMLEAIGFAVLTMVHFRSFNAARKKMILAVGGVCLAMLALSTPRLLTQLTQNYTDNQRAIERTMSLFDYSSISQARSGAMDRFLDYAQLIPFGAGLSRVGAAAGKFSDLNDENRNFAYHFFADNLWIELLVDLGLPGMIVYSAILILIILKGIWNYKVIQDDHIRGIYAAILCTLVSILIGGFGAEPILYNPEGFFFWFFSGVLMRLPLIEEK